VTLRSKFAAALVGAAVAGCLAGTVGAGAAQVGVNAAPPSGDYFRSAAVRDAIARLHPAWVRVFMGWNAAARQLRAADRPPASEAAFQAFLAASRRGGRLRGDC